MVLQRKAEEKAHKAAEKVKMDAEKKITHKKECLKGEESSRGRI